MGWFPWYLCRKGGSFNQPRVMDETVECCWNDNCQGSAEALGEQCHVIHHKCHVDLPGTASGTQRWEAGKWPHNSITSYVQNVNLSCVLHTSIKNYSVVQLLRLFHEPIISLHGSRILENRHFPSLRYTFYGTQISIRHYVRQVKSSPHFHLLFL
jgi:hypothetical protein